MNGVNIDRTRWTMGGGATVLATVGLMLAWELWEAGQPVWNAVLLLIMLALLIGATVLQRYFRRHIGEIGEARFDTRNKSDLHG